MVLRPRWSAVGKRALVAVPIAVVGGVAAYGAGSAGKPIGVLIGIPMIGLAAFMVLNMLTFRVRLVDGVLSSGTLFEKHSVAVSDVTALVPVEIAIEFTFWPNKLMNGSRLSKRQFLDVRTERGSTGIWLNSRILRADKVHALLNELPLESEPEVDHQTMSVSRSGRTVYPASAVEATHGRLPWSSKCVQR
jgi:hypothetical protein